MENIDKYIFDPENPHKCKVYNLLLNIQKEKNFATILSPMFYLQLFEKKIENKFEEEVWDKPSNFVDMTFDEKIKLFIEQNSVSDLIKENFTTLSKFLSFTDLFGPYENSLGRIHWPHYNGGRIINAISLMDFSNEVYHKYVTNDLFQNDPNDNSNITTNSYIFFLDNYNRRRIDDFVPSNRSIIIVDEKDYQKIENGFGNVVGIQNCHPLILKKRSDIHLLIDILQRDLKMSEVKQNLSPNTAIHTIESLKIDKYFCIENLELTNLKDHKEIYILGENGDGKTLLLQSIILALHGTEEGKVLDYLKSSDQPKITLTLADGSACSFGSDNQDSKGYQIIAYGVGRNRNDSDKCDTSGYLSLFSGEEYLNNPVKWLQYLDYREAKGETGAISLAKAIEMLQQILNENVEITITPSKVTFVERGTEVLFDQLAEGYKSVLIWITDMIQRLSEFQPEVTDLADYRGTVLVDEIGLHLHPKWEYRIVRDVRRWFPGIQFIFTTHSPTVILGSSAEALFYKLYKKNGITQISQPLSSIKNQMANTLITSPLFGVETASAQNSIPAEVSTDEDYFFKMIHDQIKKEVSERSDISEAELQNLISSALDTLEIQENA